jgi:hypothetical protein
MCKMPFGREVCSSNVTAFMASLILTVLEMHSAGGPSTTNHRDEQVILYSMHAPSGSTKALGDVSGELVSE